MIVKFEEKGLDDLFSKLTYMFLVDVKRLEIEYDTNKENTIYFKWTSYMHERMVTDIRIEINVNLNLCLIASRDKF